MLQVTIIRALLTCEVNLETWDLTLRRNKFTKIAWTLSTQYLWKQAHAAWLKIAAACEKQVSKAIAQKIKEVLVGC